MSPQPLEYSVRLRGLPAFIIWLTLILIAFIAATCLLFQGSLHNDNPYWIIWLPIAVVATPIAIRLLPRHRAPVYAPLLWLFLCSLWAAGIFQIYHRFADPDPHVTTRGLYRCQLNLVQLGQYLQLYANEHGHQFPDHLEEILEPNEFGDGAAPDLFITPFTNDTPATGPTTRAVAGQLTAPGHCSYIYVGKGLPLRSPSTAVLLYDPLSNHQQSLPGIHVLYMDGHVEFIPPRKAKKMIDELQAGHNTPRPEKLD